METTFPSEQPTKQPGFCAPPPTWSPNLSEFTRRFHGEQTNGMGPYWLRNLYFLYLLELRALSKASAYLAAQKYYTGETEEDVDTQVSTCRPQGALWVSELDRVRNIRTLVLL